MIHTWRITITMEIGVGVMAGTHRIMAMAVGVTMLGDIIVSMGMEVLVMDIHFMVTTTVMDTDILTMVMTIMDMEDTDTDMDTIIIGEAEVAHLLINQGILKY